VLELHITHESYLPDMVAWCQAAPWREAGREADALVHGARVADLRAS